MAYSVHVVFDASGMASGSMKRANSAVHSPTTTARIVVNTQLPGFSTDGTGYDGLMILRSAGSSVPRHETIDSGHRWSGRCFISSKKALMSVGAPWGEEDRLSDVADCVGVDELLGVPSGEEDNASIESEDVEELDQIALADTDLLSFIHTT